MTAAIAAAGTASQGVALAGAAVRTVPTAGRPRTAWI
jgi:hypothetical protein